jgi:hypothetical protein
MGAWEEYQSAAQRLDQVRRDAATTVAERASAQQAAQHDLAAVRQRLALQHARITDLAARAGLPAPILTPDPPVPDPSGPVAAKALLHNATTDLDAADAAVSEVDTGTFTRGPFPDLPQPLRNIIVYGGIALLVLLVDLWLLFAPSSSLAQVAGLAFAAILPAIGYGVALLTLPLLYGKVDRTPVLGAAISAAPVVLLCLWTIASTLL